MARPLWLRARVALLCVLVARAAGYTVDCNHEYTDCDSELSKLTLEEDEITAITANLKPKVEKTTTTPTKTFQPVTTPPLPSTTVTKVDEKVPLETTNTATTDVTVNEVQEPTEATETKPRGRLLNLNVDDLQNFANTLHNQTQDGTRKHLTDLSDVNLDDDDHEEDEAPSRMTPPDHKGHDHHVPIPDNFYTNLQAPFSPLLTMMSAESDTCKENGITYKVGERMERSCEEICECTVGGMFDCTPRCKHPLVRRGRRLNDPLCFESPVDECCSIIACATGNAENKPVRVEVCRYGNETHPVGTSWEIGCEQKCVCEHNSVVTCKPRCAKLPLSDKCINVQDPNDECCEVQVCDVSQDVHEEHIDNVTSSTTAKPISSITTEQALRGFEDYSDMIKSSEMMTKATMRPLVLVEPIGSIKVLQNNSVQVNLMHDNSSEDPIHLLLSDNGGENFEDVELKYSNLILNLEGGKDYILKTKETGTKFNFTITTNPDLLAMNGTEAPIGCHEGGFFYAVGEEFHIGCSELCECTGNGLKECVDLVCPNHVGLELVSKGCVKWAPNPAPEPPNCCPRSARCLSDGTCQYKGIAIPNWSEVPISLTGCEYRCFCENGELDCQEVCTAPPPVPPQTLRCPPQHHPAQVNVSDEDCCKQWGCEPNAKKGQEPPDILNPTIPFLPTIPPNIHFPHDQAPDYENTNNLHRPVHPLGPTIPSIPSLPPGIDMPQNYPDDNKKLSVISLQADSPTSIKLLFGLPPVLVGLRGSVDLRYTENADDDISHWRSQVYAPADEVLTTPRLEFRLTGLKPSTMYKIRGKLFLHNLPVEPQSDIYTVRTLDLPTVPPPLEEKRKEVDTRLIVVEVNDTVAHVAWRHFNDDELQFIDGIQVRYRPVGTPIYSMTELLHHGRSVAELHELRPGTRYEASLVLVPPLRATTELHDPGVVEFTTAPYVDPYNWSVTVETRMIGSQTAEITWIGVPSPAERWVRVYRAAHACGGARKERDDFKLATRDLPPTIIVSGLEPKSRCRVWLELFLTNGKVKTSNVLEITTKAEDMPEDIDNEVKASSVSGARGGHGDYYGALVGVGAVAALGALASLLLLLVVLRRHRPRSVPITPVPSAPRESSLPPYDNPAYKLELQQETMDL